jgi:uncharacterized protein
MRFVADVMLGRLAKWLRVLGFDTRYQSFDPVGPIGQMAREGRIPLTRQRKLIPSLKGAVFFRHNAVGNQLGQLKEVLSLETCRAQWFSRCIRCNVPLTVAPEEDARDNTPEYIYYENMKSIRFCPGCGRYFWPGSHRTRMEKQLHGWGFL